MNRENSVKETLHKFGFLLRECGSSGEDVLVNEVIILRNLVPITSEGQKPSNLSTVKNFHNTIAFKGQAGGLVHSEKVI